MYKKNVSKLQAGNKDDVTGHDRYCRGHRNSRKSSKKFKRIPKNEKFAGRKTQSATELNARDLAFAAAASAARGAPRSCSSEEVSRTPLDALVKLIPCISLSDDDRFVTHR